KMAASDALLFAPRHAYQIKRSVNLDTPLPPEEPAGKNPPDGAIIYYYLKAKPEGPVRLEIFDAADKLVRWYSSLDKPEPVVEKNAHPPTCGFPPPQILSAEPGMHRFVWDLHGPPPKGPRRYPISAIYRDTPSEPLGPAAPPGNYTVKLTVDGQTYSRP